MGCCRDKTKWSDARLAPD